MRRMWIVMAAAAGVAAAQDKPEAKPAPEQQKKFEALNRALRRAWEAERPPVKPNSPKPCAIPLLNVLKLPAGAPPGWPDPKMVMQPGPSPDPKIQAQVPAPSCDDVKK